MYSRAIEEEHGVTRVRLELVLQGSFRNTLVMMMIVQKSYIFSYPFAVVPDIVDTIVARECPFLSSRHASGSYPVEYDSGPSFRNFKFLDLIIRRIAKACYWLGK